MGHSHPGRWQHDKHTTENATCDRARRGRFTCDRRRGRARTRASGREKRHHRHRAAAHGCGRRWCHPHQDTARRWRSTTPTPKGGAGGYKLDMMTVSIAAPRTAGQYDPAQAATNAKKFVCRPERGRDRRPGDERRRQGDDADPLGRPISPPSRRPRPTRTSPIRSSPASIKPDGKAIYFRTVTTDAYQGPNMANYMRDTLHVKSVYILDDSGAYGVGMSNAVRGPGQEDRHERAWATTSSTRRKPTTRRLLTKIKGLNPDAVYYGGVAQAGVKVAKQAYDIMPNIIKAGGDGMVGRRHPLRRRLPGDRGLVRDPSASPHVTRRPGERRLGRALHQDVQHDARRLCDHRL